MENDRIIGSGPARALERGETRDASGHIPVYYRMKGSGVIYVSSLIGVGERVARLWGGCPADGSVHQESAPHGRDVGGWTPLESTFLSERQCRKYHRMPPIDWTSPERFVAQKLRDLADQIAPD